MQTAHTPGGSGNNPTFAARGLLFIEHHYKHLAGLNKITSNSFASTPVHLCKPAYTPGVAPTSEVANCRLQPIIVGDCEWVETKCGTICFAKSLSCKKRDCFCFYFCPIQVLVLNRMLLI